jgi:excisionase family DNA binding protein
MAKGNNVFTTGDIAKICNVAQKTVSKWFDNGQLSGYRLPGSNDRRVPFDDLVKFMQVNNMPLRPLREYDKAKSEKNNKMLQKANIFK